MHYFDSREGRIRRQHILASGALPPAFPAVRIDGDLYWDGGILSNTPVEAVFDDRPRRNSLVFSVQLWHPRGPEPNSIWQVMSRQKDVQFASRTESQVARQKQLHRLRHIIAELASHLPEEQKQSNRIKMLQSYGCVTRMHVVRLLAPQLARRGSHQGHRLQPERHPPAARRRTRRHAARPRIDAVEGRIRSDGRLHPARGGSRGDLRRAVGDVIVSGAKQPGSRHPGLAVFGSPRAGAELAMALRSDPGALPETVTKEVHDAAPSGKRRRWPSPRPPLGVGSSAENLRESWAAQR